MLQSGVLSLALLALTGAITCPDGETCHDGSSCCLTKSGRYGCCPLARSLPMVRASSGNDGNDTFCPDGSRCPSEYSCSKSHSVFKCCPLPQGVSCSDGNHCCPEGHRCGEDGLSCIKEKVHTGAIMCPDGVSECPDETTCCQLPDRTWGCCPLPQAVCCSDHLHCCPSGTKCDLAHDTCTSAYSQTPLVKKIPASKVVCPDKTTKCPDGNTCCRMADRRYGCCSLARAVCCEDHIHCCPEGTECDMAHSACISPGGNSTWATKLRARGSVPWLEKVPPLIHSTNKAEDVPCDSTHACPDGTTCCKTESGDWACCLMPEAVCCEDHTHCCPHGTTCDVAAGSCNDAKGSVPWLEKVPPLIHSPNKAEDVPCDSTHACPDGTTCCKTESGEWACCFLPEAVCCEDHTHCCPHGTTCDVAAGSCNDAKGSVPWLEKVPPLIHSPNKAEDVPCDSTHACPDGTTCCKTESGEWACCFLPEAVCCEDHIHCCPKGTTCDAAGSTCNNATGSMPWLEKVPPLIHRPNKAEDVPCDPTHACPDGTTCCKTEHGDWACCPLPEAVCCEDHIHCCPKGTTCDAAGSTCNNATGSMPWLEKVPPLIHRPNKAEDVPCDPTHACPDGTTCCKTEHGDWACCPLPEAVCCEDHIHCCPKGTTCDAAGSTCNHARGSVPWLEKVPPLIHRPNKAKDVPCDPTHACPDGTTCCKTEHGDWACCPLPEAVCCEDHIHCCPKGTTCDAAGSTCNNATGSMPWLEKVPPLIHRPNKAEDVPCDPTHACPDGTTCCKTEHGDWACCPLPEAVCCEDHIHCCPKGTTCDAAGSTCNNATGSMPWLEKVPPLIHRPNKAEDVPCDPTHACPDGTTCCKTEHGDWACCPLPEAVCCEDHIHCCPKGTTCDAAGSTCNNATGSMPWLEKVPPLIHRPNKAEDVPCDPTHACPDGTTCCKTEHGDWACCPLPEAVCCEDHIHCCPKGTTCDAAGSTCNNATGSMPWLEKVPPLIHRPNKAEDVPCDPTHACPDGTTCCKTEHGDWACCPLPEAVCCEDHIHCCPKGTTCDAAGSTCNNATGSMPWLEKVPPLIHRPNKAEDVPCDPTHACPDGTTCCKTEHGDWACCPLPEAVCCEDHIHCCPKGTTCDAAGSTCNNATGSMPWLEKVPPLIHRPNKAEDVPCDPTHACPDGTTCCKTEHGDWACCPLPEAVCCEDHIHCCPKGTTCDAAGSTCNNATGSMPWLEKVPPLIHRPNKAEDVPCDPTHACPDGTTCCKTEHGDWACCPLPEAVCCEDHIHCCPKGTTCDAAGSTCNHARGSVPWLEKVPPLIHRPNKAEDVPCDPTHACPDGTTCCKTEHGDWACCPLPEAVCCEDHIHCCPKGTTCDAAGSTCNHASGSVPWLEKVPPLIHRPNKAEDVPCDPTHACPDGTTCCKTEHGDWACCPLPEAVCCEDHIHCCPKGTTCDAAGSTCNHARGSVLWLEKVPPLIHRPNKAEDVPCDPTHACPDGTTCCKTEHGDWACCPLPEAVCCGDMKHCCPSGYSCDPTNGSCYRSGPFRWDNLRSLFRKRLL
ncbi:neurogenic locus notch homolog protein 1-like isoform X2 [Conger conger]|uniref:neurogenic locus notch homolog protein 1-like isoform X2 n=1 Tax=Conger conger TaxID=82655 RepID=UPI002A598A24|nr:neurogenic locus notch homolog protein 1-like isoform X2 [Conger conger]